MSHQNTSSLRIGSTMKPSFIKSAPRGTTLISVSLLIGLITIFTITAISFLGNKLSKNFTKATNSIETAYQPPDNSSVQATDLQPPQLSGNESCQDLYAAGNYTSGIYDIDTASGTLPIYCHMVTNRGNYNGGWALATIQYETNQVSWGFGIEASRDRSTYLDTSFSLHPNQIPNHQHIGFGSVEESNMELLEAVSVDVTYRAQMSKPLDPFYLGDYFYLLAPHQQHYHRATAPNLSGTESQIRFYRGNSIDCANTGEIMSHQNEHVTLKMLSMEYGLNTPTQWRFDLNHPSDNSAGACYAGLDYRTTADAFGYALFVR